MSERGVGGVERGINRVLMVGRLVCEPELRELPGGGSVCFLRVACAVGRRPGGSRGRLAALDVLVLGGEARRCGRYLCVGRAVGIRGRLESARWEAGVGREWEASCVVAERVQFLDAASRAAGAVGRSGKLGVLVPEASRGPARSGWARDAAVGIPVAVGFSEEMWDVGEVSEVMVGRELLVGPVAPGGCVGP